MNDPDINGRRFRWFIAGVLAGGIVADITHPFCHPPQLTYSAPVMTDYQPYHIDCLRALPKDADPKECP